MEVKSDFYLLPSELMVEILLLLPTASIASFASASKAHQDLFERKNGLYERLFSKISHWSQSEVQKMEEVDWKQEFRVTFYYNDKIRFNKLKHLTNNKMEPLANILFPEISPNHFASNPNPQKIWKLCPTFSETPLYPIPVGNFTVAYFEVDVLALNEQASIHIGCALEGYVAMAGLGRNSYAYDNEGNFLLESELSPNDVPKFGAGDTIGCGINFEKNSIFFTKNGQIIGEKTHTYLGLRLMNLKTLHATIGCLPGGSEFTANFGSRPFKFDTLKFQQMNCSTNHVVREYSSIILQHLMRFTDDETLEEYSKEGNVEKTTTNDYNLPDPDMDLNVFLYMATYQRDPRPDGFSVEQFIQFGFSQLLISNVDLILSWEHVEIVKTTMRAVATSLALEVEGLSYADTVMTIYRSAKRIYIETIFSLILHTETQLAEYAFKYTNPSTNWALVILAFFQLRLEEQPLEHYSRQAAARILADRFDYHPAEPTFTQQDVFELFDKNFFWFSFYFIREIARQQVILKKNKKTVQKKFKESPQIGRLFGAGIIPYYTQALRGLPLPRLDLIQVTITLKISKSMSPQTKDEAILYGIIHLKLPLENYSTEDDYVEAVIQAVKQKEAPLLLKKKRFLETLALYVSDADKIILVEISALIFYLFGINCSLPNNITKTRENIFAVLESEIHKIEIEMEEEKEEQEELNRKKMKSIFTSKTLLIGAGIVLAVTIGALFARKKAK